MKKDELTAYWLAEAEESLTVAGPFFDNAVMANVAAFLERLKAAGMQIAGAYLFGSHLTGKADEWSDIDVAVISPQIGADRFEERVRLTKIALAIDDRIEPLP